MRELQLRCPRCGSSATAAQGVCPECGLEIQFERHASKSERGFAELSRGASLHAVPDPYAPGPAAPFPGGAGGGSTGRYDISAEFEINEADVGDVEVGGMRGVLMDVSDVGSAQEDQPEAAEAPSGDELQLGKHAYVDERAVEEEKERAAAKMKTPPADELSELEGLAPSEAKAAARKATAEEARKALVNRFLIKRLMPQVVALFLVLILGSIFVKGPARLDGDYEVTFSFTGQPDQEDISFKTTFRYAADDKTKVRGNLKLNTAARNIPAILDAVYQDGYILFEGSTNGSELALLLGSNLADKSEMLNLTTTFNSTFSEGEGKLTDAQGGSVNVSLKKLEK